MQVCYDGGMNRSTVSQSLGQTVTAILIALIVFALIGAAAFEVLRALFIHNTRMG